MNQNDYYTIHQDQYKFILNKIDKQNPPQKAKILDVGCYLLHIFNRLQKKEFDVYGISSPHESIDNDKIKIATIEKDGLFVLGQK